MPQPNTLSGLPASRLGLSVSPEMDPGCVAAAWSGSVSWFFLYDLEGGAPVAALADLLRRHREDVVVATGTQERDPATAAQDLDAACRRLGVDSIDAFFAEYLSPEDDLDALLASGGLFDTLAEWRGAGRIRYVGASCHSRPLATRLSASGRIDLLMHRYNMAHRGAEGEVLPTALRRGVPVVAFTCTRWGSLLRRPRSWREPSPTAADCYRFALAHPAVRVALTAPLTAVHLQQNLEALSVPPPDAEELERWRRYGAQVYGKGTDAFDTDWP